GQEVGVKSGAGGGAGAGVAGRDRTGAVVVGARGRHRDVHRDGAAAVMRDGAAGKLERVVPRRADRTHGAAVVQVGGGRHRHLARRGGEAVGEGGPGDVGRVVVGQDDGQGGGAGHHHRVGGEGFGHQ